MEGGHHHLRNRRAEPLVSSGLDEVNHGDRLSRAKYRCSKGKAQMAKAVWAAMSLLAVASLMNTCYRYTPVSVERLNFATTSVEENEVLQPQQRGSASAPPTIPIIREGMGACLLVKDDNHLLVEWLAYHYISLPLVHLVVAVDPESVTSPLPVLQRWGHVHNRVGDRYAHDNGSTSVLPYHLELELWTDEDYIPKKELLELKHELHCHRPRGSPRQQRRQGPTVPPPPLGAPKQGFTGQHMVRQNRFINACAKHMRERHITVRQHQPTKPAADGTSTKETKLIPSSTVQWVVFVDTDEFITLNNINVTENESQAMYFKARPDYTTAVPQRWEESWLLRQHLPQQFVSSTYDGTSSPTSVTTTILDYMKRALTSPPMMPMKAMDMESHQQTQEQHQVVSVPVLPQWSPQQSNFSRCIPMARLVFGSKATSPSENRNVGNTHNNLNNPQHLDTLRFLHHVSPLNFEANKWCKVLVDITDTNADSISNHIAQKSSSTLFQYRSASQGGGNIHRPFPEICQYKLVDHYDSLLRVHHYIGSWEGYESRSDVRRTEEKFLKRSQKANLGPHTSMLPWLQAFANTVDVSSNGVARDGSPPSMALSSYLLEGAGGTTCGFGRFFNYDNVKNEDVSTAAAETAAAARKKTAESQRQQRKPPCALLFYHGQHHQIADSDGEAWESNFFPSIQHYIVDVNPTCDIYVHFVRQADRVASVKQTVILSKQQEVAQLVSTLQRHQLPPAWNDKTMTRHRGDGEPQGPDSSNDRGNRDSLPPPPVIENFKVGDAPSEAPESLYQSFFASATEEVTDAERKDTGTMLELEAAMLAWESLEQVYQLMQIGEQRILGHVQAGALENEYYKAIGAFQLGVKYVTPVPIMMSRHHQMADLLVDGADHHDAVLNFAPPVMPLSSSSAATAVMPTKRLNDRIVFGPRSAMDTWLRLDRVAELERFAQWRHKNEEPNHLLNEGITTSSRLPTTSTSSASFLPVVFRNEEFQWFLGHVALQGGTSTSASKNVNAASVLLQHHDHQEIRTGTISDAATERRDSAMNSNHGMIVIRENEGLCSHSISNHSNGKNDAQELNTHECVCQGLEEEMKLVTST
jgi:hypothetical protein